MPTSSLVVRHRKVQTIFCPHAQTVHEHGGRVLVTSTLSVGTSFIVHLPSQSWK